MQQSNKELISVITPIWNRKKYVDRVWNSLEKQTYKNIEWIVADDGSTDGTLDRIKEIKKIANFPIVIISANHHIGKIRMDNEAIKVAQGLFIVWNDSDDYFESIAFEKMINKWNEVEEKERSMYYGITAYCKYINNNENYVINDENTSGHTLNDLRYKLKIKGDLVHFTRSELIKKNKFIEIDQMIPEGVLWTKIGNLKTKVINEKLLIKEYKVENCISFNGKMKYNKGMAYAKAVIENNLKNYNFGKKEKIKNIVNYIRYAIHGEMSVKEIFEIWGDNSKSYILILCLPLSIILVIKDILQRKVVKTHREYAESLEKLIITIDK